MTDMGGKGAMLGPGVRHVSGKTEKNGEVSSCHLGHRATF